jgi:hypothetical protein
MSKQQLSVALAAAIKNRQTSVTVVTKTATHRMPVDVAKLILNNSNKEN